MTLLNPGYLWALPVALIPIIVYYLLRFRSLRVDWGANYVLERALERLRKNFYWDQLLLIVLRTVACLLIVLAFARPTSGIGRVSAADSVHRVLVLDRSYSMLAATAESTRWAVAKEAATQLTASWGRGQVWSLLSLGREARWLVDGESFTTAEDAARVLAPLEPEDCAVSIARACERIAEKFPDGRLEVYLFTDDQAGTWEGALDVALPAGSSVYWVNPPLPSHRNVAVERVRPAADRVLTGHPNTVRVAIRNFGAEAVGEVAVELLADGAHVARETTSLLPGQARELTFTVGLEEAGYHYLTARVGEDALAVDNEAHAGIAAAPEWQALVLRDAEPGERVSCWDFVNVVGRMPELRNDDDESVLAWGAPRFALHEGAATPELGGFDLVLIDGARTLSPDLVEALYAYVTQGGALLLMADANVDATAWNELLARANLLPAPLARRHRNKLGGPVYQSLSRTESARGALAAFAEPVDGDLDRSRLYHWYELGEPVAGAEVVARFADRKAFLVERRFGPGSVLLMSGGFNGVHTNLIVREFFLPLVFGTTAQAVSAAAFPLTVGTDEPLRLQLADAASARAVKFDLGGRELVTLPVNGPVLEHTAGAPRGGLCRALVVRGGSPERIWLGVQGERVDSDLTPLHAEQKRRLVAKHGLVEVPDGPALEAELRQTRSGSDWHHLVIAGLVLGLLGEMVLQRRFV